MRSVSAELEEAILAGERVIGRRLYIDWDGDGFGPPGSIDDLSDHVGRVAVTRTLETGLPAQVRVTAGAAAAALTADLTRGNLLGAAADVTYRSASTATSGAVHASTVTLTPPAGAREGDVVLAWLVFADFIQPALGLPASGNVGWVLLSDTTGAAQVWPEGVDCYLLARRVGPAADEPAAYTFTLGGGRSYGAAAVCIGDQDILGVHAYESIANPSVDNETTGPAVTDVTSLPLTTRLDGCVVASFFAARSAVSWLAGPAGDTQRVNLVTTHATENAALLVTTSPNLAAGTYQKTATMAAAVYGYTCVVVALAPRQGGDDTQHAARTFAELNPDSPYSGKARHGRPVRTEVGFATSAGMQWVPELVGRSVAMPASSRNRQVGLRAIDNRMALRELPRLPVVLAEWPNLKFGQTLPCWPGLTSTWLVSYLLFFVNDGNAGAEWGNGYYPSPTARPSTLVWWTMHGSAHGLLNEPTYAFTQTWAGNDATRRRVAFEPGPFVSATEPAPTAGSIRAGCLVFEPVDLMTSDGRGAGRIEAWVRLTETGGTVEVGVTDDGAGTVRYALLRVTAAGALELALKQTSTGPGATTRTVAGPTLPADGGWHFIGAHFDMAAGTATFRVDDVNVAASFTAITAGTGAATTVEGTLTLTLGAQICEVQVCGGVSTDPASSAPITAATPWLNENFAPTAFVDHSDNVLDSVLQLGADLDTWGLLLEIAEAGFDAVHFDADGLPHYRTRRSDYTPAGQVIARALTATDSLIDVDYESGLAQVRNSISVDWNPVAVTWEAEIWRAQTAIRVPAGGHVELFAQIGGLALDVGTINLTAVNTAADGSGTNYSLAAISSGLAMGGLFTTSAGEIYVELDSTAPVDLYAVDTSGQPTLTVTGTIITTDTNAPSPATADDTDTDRLAVYGTQPLSVAGNRWRQRADTAAGLARTLLVDLREPQPTLVNVGIVGDPRLEIADRVTITDRDGLGVDATYRLTGVDSAHEPPGSYTQTITARQAPQVGVWGVTTFGDGTVWGA